VAATLTAELALLFAQDPTVLKATTAICRACLVHWACPWAQEAPRQLTVRPHAEPLAMHATSHTPMSSSGPRCGGVTMVRKVLLPALAVLAGDLSRAA
jgi:hypothetical protein